MATRTWLFALTFATVTSLVFGADASSTVATSISMAAPQSNQTKENIMKILITVDGKSIRATLADNASTRDFVELLPLTVTLEDYSRTEKIYYLPKKLSIKGAPSGMAPAIGDVTYYAPWGNLAIFYKDFGYSSGLIKLGRIDFGVEVLNVSGPLKARIELIQD